MSSRIQALAGAVIATTLSLTCATTCPAQMAGTWNIKAHQDAESANSTGISLMNKRQTTRAIDQFRRATTLDPGDPVPYQCLGLALARQGEYAEALDALQKSYSLHGSGETLLSTGIVYYLMHDYDAAINSWNKLLESNHKLCHVNALIGMAFLRKGEFSESEQYLERCVQCYPNSELGYYGLALSRFLRGDYKQARSAAERAETIQSYPPVVFLLACLDAVQGDRSRAFRRAQQFNTISHRAFVQRSMAELGYPTPHDFHWDPFLVDNYDNGYLLMARLQEEKAASRQRSLSSQGKAASVIAGIQRELSSGLRDFYLQRQLGLAQLAAADYSSASESLQTSLTICPDCNTDLLWLGLALARDGKHAAGSGKVREFQQRLPQAEISPMFKSVASVDPNLIEAPPVQAPAQAEPAQQQPKPTARRAPRRAPKRAPSASQEGKPVPASEF